MVTTAWLPLADFQRAGEIPAESIERFRDEVPETIVDLWQGGSGMLRHGFLRVIDPAPFADLLRRGLVIGDRAVPVFTTAFGDIVYWQDRMLSVVRFRHGVIEGLTKNLQLLPRLLADPTFYTAVMAVELWAPARETLGLPELDECFGHVPLLVLGGRKSVENLQRVKLLPHLELLVQATGPIA